MFRSEAVYVKGSDGQLYSRSLNDLLLAKSRKWGASLPVMWRTPKMAAFGKQGSRPAGWR